MSREDQISRLQGTVRELQEDTAKKESTLQKMEMDLINVEELKHKTDDNVSNIITLAPAHMGQRNR